MWARIAPRCWKSACHKRRRLERGIAHRLKELQLKTDSDIAILMQVLFSEPAELQLPTEVTYLSKLVGDEALQSPGSLVLVQFDKHGVKKTLIENAKTQSNLTVSDDDLRRIPKLVAAAVLAGLMR